MATATSAYIPFSLLLADLGLWSSEIAEFDDASVLDELGVRDTGITETPAETTAHFTLVLDRELAIPLFGMADCAIVFGGGVVGQTELAIEVDLRTLSAIRFVDVTAALRFPATMLKPVHAVDGRFEPDPARAFSEINFTATVEIGDQAVRLEGAPTLTFLPSMVGDSGVVVEATGIELFFDGFNTPAGKPTGWRGVHLTSVKLYLPDELADVVGDLSLTDAYVGNGGFSGTVATDWDPALAAELGGLGLELSHAEIAFEQNALVAGAIAGSVTVPFFDEPVDVELGLGLNGSMTIALSSPDGLATITKPDLMDVQLEALGFEIEDGLYRVVLSGEIQPLVGGLEWPSFKVDELSIDNQGNVRLEGGWLNLPSQYVLDFHGFQLEITQLGFGSTDDGGRWIGFSGGLKLVEGMPAGASVEGLRVTWYTDGRPVAITLNGVGVEFEVPGVLSFQGAVSYRELAGPVHRFDGSIRLALTSLGLEIDGQLVVGYDLGNGYPFFAIYLGIELPAGIPLGPTGLGLYGLAGLFAASMEPGKRPDEPWYGVGPGEGWYKRDPIGVAELTKWTNREGSIALGGGVTIGTVADNGFTFAGRFLLAIVFPGPIIMLEGMANILKERASLSEEPALRSIAVLDGRAGSVLVGLDAHYAFAGGGEVIDIGGGAEVYFANPSDWHLYLGQKEPADRRIRAEIFQIFEANAYFMLDPDQIATGAMVGYAEDWKFGPVRVVLEAWISGDAVLNFKPLHFAGELWLHGAVEASVFGFGFGIGADARVTADVFEPFAIVFEIEFHLSLPWPLPDFDIDLTLAWGPEPIPPALPLPLKEVAVEHFLVTTAWPLPRTADPALLSPNYDPDGDGFLDAATSTPAADHTRSPVVPLDARPHITFSRSVHDDALVGVNPQPAFPFSQPDPGWEWIGDPAQNEGPTRMRTGLKEIALERRSGSSWVTVARKGTTPNASGVPTLFGSWAPVPQLPGGTAATGTPAPVGNTKLWLWSKSAFDYTRHTTATWDDWFIATYSGYPCIPIADDERVCCAFAGLTPETPLVSPWSCPEHPEFKIGWTAADTPTVTAAAGQPPALCFDRGETARLRLERTVKEIDVFVTSQSGEQDRRCLDFRGYKRSEQPNPFATGGFTFHVFEWDGTPSTLVQILQIGTMTNTVGVINVRFRLEVTLPFPADEIAATVQSFSADVTVEAYAARGTLIDSRVVPATNRPETVVLTAQGDPIQTVVVVAPNDETYLYEICAAMASGGIVVTPIDRQGRAGLPVPVDGGVARVPGRNLREVRIDGRGAGFCLTGFCAVVGLSEADRTLLESMGEHALEEIARWSQEGDVLQPYTAYRLKIVTTLETRDFAPDAAFNTVREQTEYAYFRTDGPPGVAALSVPLNTPEPDEFDSGLDDLSRYVAQTVPPTVPAPGERPPLPRPVYRGYDTGVAFSVDYADLLYRISGRDLGLYLFDNNDRPARDEGGRLLALANQWGVAESLTLTASDTRWLDLIDASTCLTIDTDTITHTKTLTGAGFVLDGDTLYEARLIPLLLHELFTGFTVGQSASGTGATLAGAFGTWTVRDMGTTLGPSVWTIAEDATIGRRYVEQRSDIWGGSSATASPNKPGTLLLWDASADPASAWTDYRITAVLRSLDDDAIGLVFRYAGPSNHYRFAMDRQRRYRRLDRIRRGATTTLASDSGAFALDSDMTVAIEVVGDAIRVYLDGELLFHVTDATHATGGIGLYAWNNSGARFADVRVDDLRAVAPVVYRYAFTTSRFANFVHHLQSYRDEAWSAALTDQTAAAAAVAAAVPLAGPPAVPADAESRAYAALAEQAVGAAALADTTAAEATRLTDDGEVSGLLVRTAEPIDWSRTTLAVSRAAVASAATRPMADAAPATGPVKIIDWTPGVAVANDETVTLLLQDGVDLTGYRLDYRTLPSDPPPAAAAGTELLAPDLTVPLVEGAPRDTVVFKPRLDDLDPFTVVDPVGFPMVPSNWTAAGGTVTQTAMTGIAGGWLPPFAAIGTHLIAGDPTWSDAVLAATIRDGAGSGAVGLLIRYQDDATYYRFSISAAGSYRRLLKRTGASFTILWQDAGPVVAGQDYAVVIEATGDLIRVLVDGAEVCTVLDGAIETGRIGLYSWRCPDARFSDLVVAERARTLGDWTIHDIGTVSEPSDWRTGDGQIGQFAAVGESSPTAVDPGTTGTFAAIGDPAWSDIRLRALAMTSAPDAIGVAVRWRGPDDHVLFVLNGLAGMRQLIAKANGVATELWSAPAALPLGAWREIEIEAIGTRVRVLLDGALLVDRHVDGHPAGGIALYAGASDAARFSAVTVDAAAPAWQPYHTFAADEPLAAGRRVRLFAGTEADSALVQGTSEVHRFQGFASADAAGRRLPAEGVDLALVAPDGRLLHARRFAPDGAFAATAPSLLRMADGTGFILLQPDAGAATGSRLAPGIYRFAWTYRRDNTAIDPASQILRENGDSGNEATTVDVTV